MSTRPGIRTLLLAAVAALTLSASQAFAASIPSCYDYAKTQEAPGASSNCAPIRVPNDEAFKLLKSVQAKKIGFDYYIFFSPKDVEEYPTKERWRMLLALVSSILSLYGENSDIYIARRPTIAAERRSALLGRIPQPLLLARARYNCPATRKARRADDFPPDHHRRLYTLIVY